MRYCDNPNCECHRDEVTHGHGVGVADSLLGGTIVEGVTPLPPAIDLHPTQVQFLNEATLTKPQIERAVAAKLPGARIIIQHHNGKRFWQIVLKVSRPQDGKGKYRRYTASLKLDPTADEAHAKCAELFDFMRKNGDA